MTLEDFSLNFKTPPPKLYFQRSIRVSKIVVKIKTNGHVMYKDGATTKSEIKTLQIYGVIGVKNNSDAQFLIIIQLLKCIGSQNVGLKMRFYP